MLTTPRHVLKFVLIAQALFVLNGLAQPSPIPKPTPVPGQQLPNAAPDLSFTAEGKWKVNDNARPKPAKVEPKPAAELDAKSKPPAGATVLFDGTNLKAFRPSTWKVENGYVEITPKSQYLTTNESFGSCHLHLEWCSPNPPVGTLQMKGNSGVFLMGRYEIQVLDSNDNATYADGIAGAVYGQTPPSVNPIRPTGEWQYYDIYFKRPQFDASGLLIKPATVTIDFNGVRVQENTVIEGSTGPSRRRGYVAHAEKLPLQLQEHGCAVRYRNLWIESLAD
jgi:hypothetical protein